MKFFIHIMQFIRYDIVKGDGTCEIKGTGCVWQRKRTRGSERKRLWQGRALRRALPPKPEAGGNA